MNSRELIQRAIRCEETPRAPWAPFVGCHAGALLNKSAEEFLKSGDLLVEGVQAAIDRYKPDGIPVLFDLQLEAEVLGCDLNWSEENPPAVVSHPLEGLAGDELAAKLATLEVPSADAGRLKIVLEATRKLREANPDIALYGLITGPFTLALHLLGTNIFMKMFDAPEEITKIMEFCQEIATAMANYYIEAGCDVVALVDPMTSQIGPDQFVEYVLPYAKPVFENIREKGCLGSFFVCGHAQKNVEVMCDCTPDNLSVDENIPLDFVRDVALAKGVSFGGNMQLTAVLLLGTTEDTERNAMDCLTIGGTKGFILAPGCDLPYATPPENLEVVEKLIHDEYRQEVIQNMQVTQTVGDTLDMSLYGQSGKVIVDIITLDSEACAPCQYMVEAVKNVTPHFEGLVEWREHKIKQADKLVFMSSLMVKNIPTICIDGKIVFVSQIPPKEELIAAIQNRINEKMRGQIQQHRASIYVLGKETPQRQELIDNVERARQELGSGAIIKIVEDEDEMRGFGVEPTLTPAVVVARYRIKSVGTVPEVAAVKEWLREE